jgi:ADP-ribose pyrophosphatase YjhB (NUDIX family)
MDKKTIAAAGTLVVKDNLVLAIEKDGEFSFPCGKVNHDESLVSAARRETKEETGYEVYVRNKRYIGNDSNDRTVCIYKASIMGGEIKESTEGKPVWVERTELTKGTYGEFNTAVLKYFGVL